MHPVSAPLPLQPAVGQPASGILARRLDRLRLKLFVAIAGANALLALIAYLVFSTSFEQGVVESLMRRDLARLQAFSARLAEQYGREGSWQSITADPERW